MQQSEFDLINLIKRGDSDAFVELSSNYKGLIHSVISSFNVSISEKEDLFQEGLIGLYKAALTFDNSFHTTFSWFAKICIRHSVISALRAYYSEKNISVRSCSYLCEDGENYDCLQSLDKVTEPERQFIEKENYKALMHLIDTKLSPLESRVLHLFVQGNSYADIASSLNISEKSVDNAIQRIRSKLKFLV